MNSNLSIRLLLLLTVLFCLPVSASAQEKKSEQLTAALLTLERKRDVSIPDFEAAIKKHLAFRLTVGEGRHYQVYTPTEGGDYLLFFVRYATVTLAEQDQADDVVFSSDIPANYVEVLSPLLQELTYKQEWIDTENSNWTWPASDQAELVGVTTWSVNPAKSIQMNKARARLSQIALEKGKANKWFWFTTVGGEETLSLAIPYNNNIERGQVQSFADFAAEHIGKEAAEELEQQFNEGFWSKSYQTLHYRPDLSLFPEGEESK